MAFVNVEIGDEGYTPYWRPNTKGESIEGNIYDFEENDYGNKQIVLYVGEENDDMLLTTLPSHRNLMRYYSNLEIGDYIRVTVTDVKAPMKEGQFPINIYKVEKDPDQFIEFDE